MQTRRLLTSSLAATAGLSIVPFSAKVQAPSTPDIQNYNKPGEGSVNSYLLVGPRSVAIIDCQRALPEARQLLDRVRSVGKPVEAIVITHEHIDHVGGLDLIARAFPASPILASPTTREAIAQEKAALIPMMSNRGKAPGLTAF